MEFSKSAVRVIRMLRDAGFEAFLVGGSVRDAVMGQPPSDSDICTAALPEETREVFRDFPVIDTGIKHGTVTVVMDTERIEVTTYRSDGEYTDSRHPDRVTFVKSAREDCARRDFTMNALLWEPESGITDYFGGMEDIKDRLVRCIGDPKERFSEDALRILRRLRFSSKLGFGIAEETGSAIHGMKDLLLRISPERIYSELKGILTGDNVRAVLMEYPDVLGVFIPEILPMVGFDQKNRHHIYDVWEHTRIAVEKGEKDELTALSLLFHDIGKPSTFTLGENGQGHFYGHGEVSFEITKGILNRLRASNDEKERIERLVRYHDLAVHPTERSVRRALARFGEEDFRRLIRIKRADNLRQNYADYPRDAEYDRLERVLNEVIEKEQCFSLKQLALNGKDLIGIGYPASRVLGEELDRLLEMVIEGSLPNDRQQLLEEARARLNGHV